MIVHIVMINPRADLEPAAVETVMADLQNAAREIPSIRRLRVGARVKHGLGGYEQAMVLDYMYFAEFEFDDVRGLQEYLRHPSHDSLNRHFGTMGQRALAYDYELTEIER